MSEVPNNSELTRQIQSLHKTMTEQIEHLSEDMNKGFEGVHRRQDEANHATAKNTEFRIKSIAERDLIKFAISALGVGNIVALVKIFL